MRVFLTGASGFLGRKVVEALGARGDRAVVLTRDAARARERLPEDAEVVEGDPTVAGGWQEAVAGCDAAVNLAGAPIDGRRWNAQYRQQIHDSRVDTTRFLVEAIAAAEKEARPRALVSASGIDYYPFSLDLGAASRWDEDDEVDESAPPGDGFLARVCRHWEEEAREAERLGVRVALARFGIVLGEGGALAKMAAPFRFFAGGWLGRGRQWMSWVHRRDAVRAVLRALDEDTLSGPVNVVAPQPVRNRDFCRALGRALRRPCWLPVPGPLLELAVGQVAEYALHGRRAVPTKLERAGFSFDFPELDAALRDALGR